MKKKTHTFYEVSDGHGLIGKWSTYSFSTQKEAADMAKEFKNNPRSHNDKMTDENVRYWQNKTYTVIKKTVTEQQLETI